MLIAHWLTKYVLPTISSCWVASGESPQLSKIRISSARDPPPLQSTSTSTSTCAGLLTYGGNEGCVEGVVGEAEQHTGLPHARVSDQKQLEQQVVRLLRH